MLMGHGTQAEPGGGAMVTRWERGQSEGRAWRRPLSAHCSVSSRGRLQNMECSFDLRNPVHGRSPQAVLERALDTRPEDEMMQADCPPPSTAVGET